MVPCSPLSTIRGPTGALWQDTPEQPLRRCRGPAALSASQRVGGSPSLPCARRRADTPFEDPLVRSLSLDGRTPLRDLAHYAIRCIFMVPPTPISTLKLGAVVVIGVDRRGVGRDNGARPGFPFTRRSVLRRRTSVLRSSETFNFRGFSEVRNPTPPA